MNKQRFHPISVSYKKISDTMKIPVLIIALICLAACKKNSGDTTKPLIQISSPTPNQQFTAFSTVTISGTVTDDDQIHEVHVEVVNKNNSTAVIHFMEHVDAKTYNIQQAFVVQAGITYKIHVEAHDHVGNIAVVEMEVKGI
jgi:hypothetical protein